MGGGLSDGGGSDRVLGNKRKETPWTMDEAEQGRYHFLILIWPVHDNKKTSGLFGWSIGHAVQL